MKTKPEIKTISDLRNAVSQHIVGNGGIGGGSVGNVRNTETRWNPTVTHNIWNKLLHDRRMPKRQRMTRKRGGASYELAGAPLDYAMVPGGSATAFTTNPAVAVYDRFPIDPTVNPQVVSDLDVFFGSALTRGCGVENTSLQVPADMGSNQVGGKRKNKRNSRKIRGGYTDILSNVKDFGDSMAYHPYMNSSVPTLPHSLNHQWQGKLDTIPASSDPTDHTWSYATEMAKQPVNPRDLITAQGPTAYLYQTTNMGNTSMGASGGSTQSGGRYRKTRRSGKARKGTKTRKSRKVRKYRK